MSLIERKMDDHDHHNDAIDRPLSRSQSGDDRKSKTCRVCGDRALSVNFNVVTCESCKAFFRRNALKPKAFRCPFSGECEINVVSRKFCKKCRLRKCFEVGMMKEWIMTDEARLKKRDLINTNRDKRRTVIMATAAKHGLDAPEVEKLDPPDEASCLDTPQHHSCGDEGYLSSERSHDGIIPGDQTSRDHLITIPKSALIAFAVQCRSQNKDLNSIIDNFIEHHAVKTGDCTRSAFTREPSSELAEAAAQPCLQTSILCDCGLCAAYRLKIPGLNMSHNAIASLSPQIQLPPFNTDLTRMDESTSGNMLSLLAPCFGKYFHAVDYSLANAAHISATSQPRPSMLSPVKPSHWTDSSMSMPSIPLDIPPHIYDMVNLPLQRPAALSCPLPVRLVIQPEDTMPPLVHDDIGKIPALLSMDGKSVLKFNTSPSGETSTNSILGLATAGKLAKLPYSMLPRLQELLDAKKFLLLQEDLKICGPRTGQPLNGSSEEFFNHITSFNRLLESDRKSLLNGNRSEISILRQLVFYEFFKAADVFEKKAPQQIPLQTVFETYTCEKYVRLLPKIWRNDDCIMLTLMAIAVFNTSGCQLLCKNAIDEERDLYRELLKRYLECIYKPGDVEAAQTALLDLLFDLRYECTGAASTPEARLQQDS